MHLITNDKLQSMLTGRQLNSRTGLTFTKMSHLIRCWQGISQVRQLLDIDQQMVMARIRFGNACR